MNNSFVIDTFAWIEYFLGTKRGERVKSIIENNDSIFIILYKDHHNFEPYQIKPIAL